MTNTRLLASAGVVAFVPTKDPDLARAFYEGRLGLTLVSEDGFALVFEGNGAAIRVVRVQEFQPAPFTILGWNVPNIEDAAAWLRDRGITFRKYAGLQQDDSGIWTSPSGARVAWFSDPDGNVLSISQG